MARARQKVLEYRTYDLPAEFPMVVLTGDRWHISPVRSSQLHIHNCLEIGMCHEQSGWMTIGDRDIAFSAGTVTVVGRNVPHTTWSAPGENSLWSYVYVDAEGMLGQNGLTMLPDLQQFYRMMMNGCCVLPREDYPWAAPLFREMLREYAEKQPGYRNCIRGLLMTLLIRLSRVEFCEWRNPEDIPESKDLSTIGPAVEYMRRHYDQAVSMEELAAMCHISQTHLRRLFASQMSINPLEFLHQLRVFQSCRLLRTTDRNISDIATRVGYVSLCSYNQHFRRIMGCTPSEWRRASAGGTERPSLIMQTGWLEAEHPEEEAAPAMAEPDLRPEAPRGGQPGARRVCRRKRK